MKEWRSSKTCGTPARMYSLNCSKHCRLVPVRIVCILGGVFRHARAWRNWIHFTSYRHFGTATWPVNTLRTFHVSRLYEYATETSFEQYVSRISFSCPPRTDHFINQYCSVFWRVPKLSYLLISCLAGSKAKVQRHTYAKMYPNTFFFRVECTLTLVAKNYELKCTMV
jgi:hypothetical protein